MDPFFHLVERRLEEAERAGAFRSLAGAGRPLALEDLSAVPAELRASYLLLKGAGFVPPELEARKEWLRLRDLLAACEQTSDQPALQREEQRAWLRYRLLTEERGGGAGWFDYRDAIAAKLAH
jgi:hypothetical protein